MAEYQLVIIGGGLSGIAAGIRAARFGEKTLILEQHFRPGGLNSYYQRQGHLFETGLHAMTNFAGIGDKRAPLNRLFRQLQLSRKSFTVREQICSEIRFPGRSLLFSNDPFLLEEEIFRLFPESIDAFLALKTAIRAHDPFVATPWRSARRFLATALENPDLEDMILLPLMVYGNAEEHDMDLSQFVIMFRAVFEEGFFRPAGTMKDFLSLLVDHYRQFGGEFRFSSPVEKIIIAEGRAQGVRLEDGTEISADAVLSTAGIPETIRLSGWRIPSAPYCGRMSFMETISLVPRHLVAEKDPRRTIVFYNTNSALRYERPESFLDTTWGVVCFPDNFAGLESQDLLSIRVTHAANYSLWKDLGADDYMQTKQRWALASVVASEEIVGKYQETAVFQDSFTPLTIERFTRKAQGAVYGSPVKIRDGVTPWPNLFVAGTDQGFLGIVGAMLSGITVVNLHLLR